MDSDKLHANIRRFRENSGFSQTSMADELGIGRTTYINFETGKTRIFCKTLEKLASYFNVSEEEILYGFQCEELLNDNAGNSSEEEKRAIIREYEQRLSTVVEKLEAAERVIRTNERAIKTLSETNNFLLSQLHKND